MAAWLNAAIANHLGYPPIGPLCFFLTQTAPVAVVVHVQQPLALHTVVV